MDAILGGCLQENANHIQRLYVYFTGVIPPPMKADGQFFELELKLRRQLNATLVTTGAGVLMKIPSVQITQSGQV